MPDLITSASAELANLVPLLQLLSAGLDDAAWRQRPAPDEWSPLEIVCHMRDEEVEDFRTRLRATVDGAEGYPKNDPESWARQRAYREDNPAAVMRALAERRAESLAYLTTLKSRVDDLQRSIEAPAGAGLSGADMVASWVAHDRLHLAQLCNTLARLWADRWAPLRVEYAGDIPYGPRG